MGQKASSENRTNLIKVWLLAYKDEIGPACVAKHTFLVLACDWFTVAEPVPEICTDYLQTGFVKPAFGAILNC